MIRAVIISLLLVVSAPVAAQDRRALVVGIDGYEEIDDLSKASNDARSVSDVLDGIGFDVTTVIDADERRFNRALAEFTASIDPGDEVLFYFAGHGIEIDGRNYLLPSDAPDSASEWVIRSESINADEVLRGMQREGASVAVMILDACRDNPYARAGRSVGGARGLNIVSAPAGSFVLMSAASGAVAYEGDDDDPNSIFTRALLPLLEEPGLALPDMARRLRRDVQRLASEFGRQQRPAYYDEVAGEFFFREASAEPEVPVRQGGAVALGDPCEAARVDWVQLGGSPSASILEIFLDTHENCRLYRALAQEMLAGLAGPNVASPLPPEMDDEATSLAPPSEVVEEDQQSAEVYTSGPPEVVELRARAEDGDVDAMFDLAERYQSGQDLEQSDEEAARWYRQAAEAGNADAALRLARLYAYGRDVERNEALASRWFSVAAGLGSVSAMNALAWRYENAIGLDGSHGVAAVYYLRALRNGESWMLDNINQIQRETIVEIQRDLRDAGYYVGSLDGVVGPLTSSALRSYAQQ